MGDSLNLFRSFSIFLVTSIRLEKKTKTNDNDRVLFHEARHIQEVVQQADTPSNGRVNNPTVDNS